MPLDPAYKAGLPRHETGQKTTRLLLILAHPIPCVIISYYPLFISPFLFAKRITPATLREDLLLLNTSVKLYLFSPA